MPLRLLATAATLLLAPGTAQAHSAIQGIGTFYNGILHPLVVPAHLLLLLALGLLLAQQGSRDSQKGLLAAVVAVWGGLMLSHLAKADYLPPVILSVAALVAVLVAISRPLPLPVTLLFALGSALLLGLDSGQDELQGREQLTMMLGTGVGVTLLLLYSTALGHFFSKRAWQRIGVRVVGSWIAASSLMVLALSLAPSTV